MGPVSVAFAPALLIAALAAGVSQAGGACAIAMPAAPREVTVAPGESLQAVIDSARSGAVIRLMPGTYAETIKIAGFRTTSPESPLVITAAEGPGTVTLRPPEDAANKPTIFIIRSRHVIVDGLDIVGTADGREDSGPVKIINGTDDAPAGEVEGHVTISNNRISGSGSDCIKAGKAHNLTIVGNVFTGRYSDACIDFVTVWESHVLFNDFLIDSANGITMKGGSHDIEVANNLFQGRSLDPSVKVGGEGHSRAKRDAPGPEFVGFEARGIAVRENVIRSQGRAALWFQGARDSVFERNLVAGGGRSDLYAALPAKSSPWRNEGDAGPPYHNANNSIRDNILDGVRGDSASGADTDRGVQVTGNRQGAAGDPEFPFGQDGCASYRR